MRLLPTLAAGAALLFAAPAQATSAPGACISMGGMGNYNYEAGGRSGVAAMAGAFEGGVIFRQTSDFRRVSDAGRLEANFEHMFVTADGSTIRTQDLSWGYAVPGTEYVVGGGAYTVVEATGRFEGMRGTFHSWGAFNPARGQAVLRYEGRICRPAS
jgi:hypothetical protein